MPDQTSSGWPFHLPEDMLAQWPGTSKDLADKLERGNRFVLNQDLFQTLNASWAINSQSAYVSPNLLLCLYVLNFRRTGSNLTIPSDGAGDHKAFKINTAKYPVRYSMGATPGLVGRPVFGAIDSESLRITGFGGGGAIQTGDNLELRGAILLHSYANRAAFPDLDSEAADAVGAPDDQPSKPDEEGL